MLFRLSGDCTESSFFIRNFVMNYTLIAYTPNCSNFRHQDFCDSILKIYQSSSKEEIIENWADTIYQNKIDKYIFSGVEFTLLVDGQDRWNHDSEDNIDPFDGIEQEAEFRAKHRIQKSKDQQEFARLKEIEEQQKRQVDKDLAEFNRLSKIYGKQ